WRPSRRRPPPSSGTDGISPDRGLGLRLPLRSRHRRRGSVGAIAVVLATGRAGAARTALWATGAIFVSFSRLYLGLHWWTDVGGGMALGGPWLSVLSLTLVGRAGGASAGAQKPGLPMDRRGVADAA